jgi:hypothetical protein
MFQMRWDETVRRLTRRSIDNVTSDKCLSFVICAVLRGGRESFLSTHLRQMSHGHHITNILNEDSLDKSGMRITAVTRRKENIVRFSQAS